jgi:hypothetical protein
MDRWLAGESVEAVDGRAVGGAAGMADFVVMDPPYNIHLPQTMSGAAGARYTDEHANRRSSYNMLSNAAADLANLPTYDAYLEAMGQIFVRCHQLLQPGRYMAIIVRNTYQKGTYTFTHVDLARQAAAAGFVPKGETVWYQAGTRLRPYGYPFSYVPNIVHQYIVILQRPPRATRRTRGSEPAATIPASL